MLEMPEVQFVELSNGQKLAWREWGTGSPLIMLHGWSMSSIVFAEVAEALAGDFRLLCPDLPGHGQSDPSSSSDFRSFANAISEWASKIDVGSVDLLGWSLGGQVAMQIAADHLLLLRKLLLIATTPRFCQADNWSNGLLETQVRALDRNMGRAYEKTLGDFFVLQFVGEQMSKERYRKILQFAVRSGRLPEPDVARAALQALGNGDQRELLKKIHQPVLVMHGELDQIIPLAAGEYLCQQLPNAQFSRIPGVGHAPFFSSLKLCVEQWRNFLQ